MIKFNYENHNEDELDLFSFEDDEDFAIYMEEYNEETGYSDEVAKEFVKEFTNFLNYCMLQSDVIKEDFVSRKCLLNHFTKHCIGHTNKKSTRGRILYDFNDNSKYSDYEKEITDKINNTKYNIGSLYDYPTIMKYMRKLFEGNVVVRFCNGCCIQNNGLINISFIAYANNVTKNYKHGNTITMCIKNGSNKTISLYAIDAHDVEKRLNNTLQKFANFTNNFTINND